MHKTIDSVGEILDKSVSFYKKHWKGLARVIGGYIAIYLVAVIVLGLLTFALEPLVKLLPATGYLTVSTKLLGAVVSQFITIALSVFVIFTLPRFLHSLDEGHKPSIRGGLSFVKGRFWDLFLIMLFVYGLVYGGMLALIVPGIYFSVGTLFYPYTATLEHKKGLEALIASYWETDGKKMDVFGKIVLVGLLVAVCGFVSVAILGGLGFLVTTVFSSVVLKVVFAAPLAIIGVLFLIFVYAPFSMIPQYVIYKSLKAHSRGEIDHVYHAKKKKMFKIFIAIGLVLYIGSMLATPFFPENDGMITEKEKKALISTEPKVYNNSEFVYSLTYPGDFYTMNTEKDNPVVLYGLKNEGENIAIVAIDVEKSKDAVVKFENELKKDPTLTDLVISPAQKTMLGTLSAEKRVMTYINNQDTEKTKTTLISAALSDGWTFFIIHSCWVTECEDAALNAVTTSFKLD